MRSQLIISAIILLTLFSSPAWAEKKLGWQEWQPVPKSKKLPFDSGFSNMELGGYLDFENLCQQKAKEENKTETYWYRLNDLVETIGTGQVEWGCKINDNFATTYVSTAILSELEHPVCLRVNSDVGNGVRVRVSDSLDSDIASVLANGEKIFLNTSPAYISTDSSGRQWLEIKHKDLEGWASLRAKEGEHINFLRCTLE